MEGERLNLDATSDGAGGRPDSSEAEIKEDVEPVSEVLLGTFKVDDLLFCPFNTEQLFGTLMTQRL